MTTINRIPPELLSKIFSELDKPSLFNATMTCRQWMNRLLPSLPSLARLHVELSSLSCSGRISYRDESDTLTTLCQCNKHVVKQKAFLREIFNLFGSQLISIVIEDCLLYKSNTESIDDNSIYVILHECGKDLKSIEFSLVDLACVYTWTLAVMARFSRLNYVSFDSCEFPSNLSESMLIRMLAPSFNALESIHITNNKLISDKFTLSSAKQCVNLKELNVNGSSKITALTVVGFCEALAFCSGARFITLDLRNTLFNSMELTRYLNNPLLKCGTCWKAQPITINIGFDRRAIILNHINRNDLVIIVYISQ